MGVRACSGADIDSGQAMAYALPWALGWGNPDQPFFSCRRRGLEWHLCLRLTFWRNGGRARASSLPQSADGRRLEARGEIRGGRFVAGH
jgi:hypothetical protein